MKDLKLFLFCTVVFLNVSVFGQISGSINVPLKFDFGPGKIQSGYTPVLPETIYSAERGYGFWPGVTLKGGDTKEGNALKSDYITSNKPFYFSVNLPDGNYDVTVTFGDSKGSSSQTVRAESRRFMLPNTETKSGEIKKEKFTVHMHTINVGNDGRKVLITPRETNFFIGIIS